MKRPALLIVAALIPAASPASAGTDAHRPAIERLPVSGDLADLSACAARVFARVGKARQLQTADGFAVDWGFGGGTLFMRTDGPSTISVEFHKADGAQFVRALYRHPYSSKATIKTVRDVAAKCFPEDWNRWAAANGAKPVGP